MYIDLLNIPVDNEITKMDDIMKWLIDMGLALTVDKAKVILNTNRRKETCAHIRMENYIITSELAIT